jgi:hypothetical protein
MFPPRPLSLTYEYKKYNSDLELKYSIMSAKYKRHYLKYQHQSLFLDYEPIQTS